METNPQEQTITVEQLQALLARVQQGRLVDGDMLVIEKLIVLDIKLFLLLKKKKTTLKAVRELVLVQKQAQAKEEQEQKLAVTQSQKEKEKKPRAPGHGRNAAAAYTGAERVLCTEAALKVGAA